MTVRGKEDVLSVVRLVKIVKVCKSCLSGCKATNYSIGTNIDKSYLSSESEGSIK